jgi:hypothetical protein
VQERLIVVAVYMILHGDAVQLTAEVVLLREIEALATVSELLKTNKRL